MPKVSKKKALVPAKRRSPRSMSSLPKYLPEINERFKQIRAMRGMTMDDFAKELDITPSLVRQIESMRCNVNVTVIRNLHHKYKLRYEWIIDGK